MFCLVFFVVVVNEKKKLFVVVVVFFTSMAKNVRQVRNILVGQRSFQELVI